MSVNFTLYLTWPVITNQMQKYVSYKLKEIDQTWSVLYILEIKNQWFSVEFELCLPTCLKREGELCTRERWCSLNVAMWINMAGRHNLIPVFYLMNLSPRSYLRRWSSGASNEYFYQHHRWPHQSVPFYSFRFPSSATTCRTNPNVTPDVARSEGLGIWLCRPKVSRQQ